MVATMEKIETDREMTIHDVAAEYGVHPLTVQRRIAEHGLPAIRVDGFGPYGKFIILESHLVRYLKSNPFRNRSKTAQGT